jgi:hypothetical protein
VDHGHLDAGGTGRTHDRFGDWAAPYVRDLRSDLTGDGYDPDGTPKQLQARREQESRKSTKGCLIALALIVLAVVAWLWFR